MQRWFCRRRTWRARGRCCPGWRPASWCSGEPCLTCHSTRRSRIAVTVMASPPESAWCYSWPTSCASSSGEQNHRHKNGKMHQSKLKYFYVCCQFSLLTLSGARLCAVVFSHLTNRSRTHLSVMMLLYLLASYIKPAYQENE